MEQGGFVSLLVRGISAAAKGAKGAVKVVSKAQKAKDFKDKAMEQKREGQAKVDEQKKMSRAQRMRAEAERTKTGSGKVHRGQIVKQVMNEKGLSMIEASKYVKEHNLY